MEYLFFITGTIFGVLSSLTIKMLYDKFITSYGTFEIDEEDNLCNVKISTEEIKNKNIKKIILNVKRGLKLTREEHIL